MRQQVIFAVLTMITAEFPTALSAAEGIPHTCRWDPPTAQSHHQTGTVTLSFCIKENGYLEKLDVSDSSGFPELDRAAMWCASHWHYLPARQKGVPIEVPWCASVTWTDTSEGDRHISVTEIPQDLTEPIISRACGAPIS
ncbi:MAG: energy transducer TonB [Alphaproteobacteria bacterium]|jgi:TonB family protein